MKLDDESYSMRTTFKSERKLCHNAWALQDLVGAYSEECSSQEDWRFVEVL